MTTPNGAEITPQRPISIGKLARRLLVADRGGLEIAIPADAQLSPSNALGTSVDGGILRFASLGDRNAAAAADALAELGDPPYDAQALWTAAYDLWRHEIGNADMASGRLLAAVHSSASVLRTATSQITGPRDVFAALHLVEAALPYLEAVDLNDVIELCDAERPHTVNDLAGDFFYHALSRWLGRQATAARDVVEKLLGEPHHVRGNLLGAAWMAWFAADQQASVARLLQVDTRADLAELHDVTCWIESRMLAESGLRADLAPALEARILSRVTAEDAMQRRAGLRAVSVVLHMRRAFDEALRGRIAAGDQEAASFVAQALSHNDASLLQAGVFFEWLQLCVGLGEGFETVLQRLDFSLSKLLRPDSTNVEAVLDFLESWIRANLGSTVSQREYAERFEACTREMLSHPALLSRVFTRWMLADSRSIANAAASIVMFGRTEEHLAIGFDPTLLDAASQEDLWYLVKRMLGYLIESKQLLSFALSLLSQHDAKARVLPLMRWLLYEQIGYDYPVATCEALRSRAGQEGDIETKAMLEGIATQLEADMAAVRALPRLRELEVSQGLRRDFAKARAKVMERSMREAGEQSPFSQFAMRIHVKAGETSFQHFGGSFSEPMAFGSHSVSFELPRREVLDPVGNAYRRLQLRTTKRGHE